MTHGSSRTPVAGARLDRFSLRQTSRARFHLMIVLGLTSVCALSWAWYADLHIRVVLLMAAHAPADRRVRYDNWLQHLSASNVVQPSTADLQIDWSNLHFSDEPVVRHLAELTKSHRYAEVEVDEASTIYSVVLRKGTDGRWHAWFVLLNKAMG